MKDVQNPNNKIELKIFNTANNTIQVVNSRILDILTEKSNTSYLICKCCNISIGVEEEAYACEFYILSKNFGFVNHTYCLLHTEVIFQPLTDENIRSLYAKINTEFGTELQQFYKISKFMICVNNKTEANLD